MRGHKLVRWPATTGENFDVPQHAGRSTYTELTGLIIGPVGETGENAAVSPDGYHLLNYRPMQINPLGGGFGDDAGTLDVIAFQFPELSGNIFAAILNGDSENEDGAEVGNEGNVVQVYQELWDRTAVPIASQDAVEYPENAVVLTYFKSGPTDFTAGVLDLAGGTEEIRIAMNSESDGFLNVLCKDSAGATWYAVDVGSDDEVEFYYSPRGSASIIGPVGSIASCPLDDNVLYSIGKSSSSIEGCYVLRVDAGNSPITKAELYDVSTTGIAKSGNLGVTLGSSNGNISIVDGLAYAPGATDALLTIGNQVDASTDKLVAIRFAIADAVVDANFPAEIRANDDGFGDGSCLLLGPDGKHYAIINETHVVRFTATQGTGVSGFEEWWDISGTSWDSVALAIATDGTACVAGYTAGSSAAEKAFVFDGSAETEITLPGTFGVELTNPAVFVADLSSTEYFFLCGRGSSTPALLQVEKDGTVVSSKQFQDTPTGVGFYAFFGFNVAFDPAGIAQEYATGLL